MQITKTRLVEYQEKVPDTLEAFKNWEFSSGVTTGNDFKVFVRKFRTWIKNNVPAGAKVKISPNHYILSGFIEIKGKFVYFSISDVRHFKNAWADNILIRTADHDKDYTGGSNVFTDLENFKDDIKKLI